MGTLNDFTNTPVWIQRLAIFIVLIATGGTGLGMYSGAIPQGSSGSYEAELAVHGQRITHITDLVNSNEAAADAEHSEQEKRITQLERDSDVNRSDTDRNTDDRLRHDSDHKRDR